MSDEKQTVVKTKDSSTRLKSRLIKAAVAVIVLGSILLFDVMTPFGGNVYFYSEWMRCEKKPLISRGVLGVRFYEEAPLIGIFRGNTTKYYCTALEAEQAGLSASEYRYEFPHLEQYEHSSPSDL